MAARIYSTEKSLDIENEIVRSTKRKIHNI
jgi:hypothetical protein